MSWIAVAIIGGSVIGGAVSAYGSESAADTAASADQSSAQLQWNEFEANQANEQPWITSGQNAMNELNYMMGLPTVQTTSQANAGTGSGQQLYINSATGQIVSQIPQSSSSSSGYIPGMAGTTANGFAQWPSNTSANGYGNTSANGSSNGTWSAYTPPATSNTSYSGTAGSLLNIPAFSYNANSINSDPTYQWLQQQEAGATASAGAAAGNYGSGNMASALQTNAAGIAGTYENQMYNQALQGYNANINSQYVMPYNELAAISGTGQTTAQSLAGTGTTAAANTGSALTAAGNASASGTLGATNSLSNGIQSGYSNYLGYSQLQTLQTLLANSNGNAGSTSGSYYW